MLVNTPIIGITGKARSGKDTVANFIVAARGGYKYGFANPMRDILRVIGIDMDDPYWQDHKEEIIPALGKSPRQIMQTLGTEWGRNMVNEDLWVLMANQQVMRLGTGMIIADVRHENEAAWIRRSGGRIIHVTRGAAPAVNAHTSEAGIVVQPEDIQLSNSGTLEELQVAVRSLVDVSKT